ncbi:hypothetical protein AXF42_Ash020855 [Apostasia shenzhenica]|uniref:18S pre-ribosomal assembly protein gar2-related n=1 Tax=Apostasia shenzhenica TaxID=1088818 RepID=A0A2H9ZSR2_9ASPA|nr:hypothetical protein AXF42_Ash020855 [Apostasia shenzhenica]
MDKPIMEERINSDSPQKLKPSSADVGERTLSSQPRCVTDVSKLSDRTVGKELLAVDVCYSGQAISEEVHLDSSKLIAREMVAYKNPDKGQNCDQVTVAQNLTYMACPSPIEAKGSKNIEDGVCSNNERPEKDNKSPAPVADLNMLLNITEASDDTNLQGEIVPSNNEVSVELTETGSIMKENTKGAFDDSKLLGGETTSNLGSEETSFIGNDSDDANNENVTLIKNVAGTEQPIVDDTTSTRSSFSCFTHGDSGLPGHACLSGSDYIPFSGSISIRSDSSTTSAHSFAFPVLHSEWSSSPVKMAKPDRRHLRKQRGWRTALICCKF